MSWPWSQLGLPGPSDLSQVRHAYAEKLKTTHPEDDPEGFQRLHSAYQLASRMARQKRRFSQTEDRPPQPEPKSPQREDDIQKIEIPEGETLQETQDFNFDELLQEGGERPRRAQEEKETEQDFDFDELLQEGGERPRRAQEEEEETEQDFDFDELLQEEQPPLPPEKREERDFDFERLFAEGEAERAEARRRRGEERRKAQERWKAQKQAQERERQKAQEWAKKREHWQRQEQRSIYEQERRERFDQEQARWQSTETILHIIEMMYNSRTEAEAWQKFFQSPMFQQNKESIDLIFGLEDFVSAKRELPQKIRMALFRAYGFDKGMSRPEQHLLYQMLLPAWQAEEGEKRQKKRYKLGMYLGSLLLAPVILFLAASGWFLAVLVLLGVCLFVLPKLVFTRESLDGKRKLNRNLIWVLALGVFTYVCVDRGWGLKIPLCVLAVGLACFVLREVFRLGRQKGKPPNKRDERWLVAITVVCLAIGISMLFIPELKKGLDKFSDPRAQVCRYLEEDFGAPFQSIYNKTELEKHSNVFAPEGDVGKMFLAGPDGKRDVQEGQPGYTTNYTEMKVLWALQDFAKIHNLYGVDALDQEQGLESWETAGVYLISLDFYGEGEVITQLGELLEELAQEDWYQTKTPRFEVVLCGKQMEEGRLVLSHYQPSDGIFDAEAVRELYDTSFAHSYCAQLLKECELDRDFFHSKEEPYAMTNEGFVELKGETCCKLYGVTEDETVAMEYYVSVNSSNIYCVPDGFWTAGGTEEDIQFYRMITWGDGKVITLYCP